MVTARPGGVRWRSAALVAMLGCCALAPALGGTAAAGPTRDHGRPPAGAQGSEPPAVGQARGGAAPGAQMPAGQPAGVGSGPPAGVGGGPPTGSAPSAGRPAAPGRPSHRQGGDASAPGAPAALGGDQSRGRERHDSDTSSASQDTSTSQSQTGSAQQGAGAGQTQTGAAQTQTPGRAQRQDSHRQTGREGQSAAQTKPAGSSSSGSSPATGNAGEAPASSPSGAAATPAAAAPAAAAPAALTTAASPAPSAPAATSLATEHARNNSGLPYRARTRGHRARGARAGHASRARPGGGNGGIVAPGGLVSLAAADVARDAPPASRHTRGARAGRAARRSSPLSTTITRIVDVVPAPLRIVIALLVALSLLLALRSRLVALRAGRLERQRAELLADVGLLQATLLPAVPGRFVELGTSVAYRPADGPAAGGDFYDVFALDDGRLAIVLGDVSGHGRQALPYTALVRFTLRAYLEAGLSPRLALQTAGQVLERQLDEAFATVAVATYDPAARSLVYSCAGHPPPLVIGSSQPLEALTLCAAPPVGAGLYTGTRQTTLALPGRARICLYTDGVTEARVAGELYGTERLAGAVAKLGPRSGAAALLDAVAGATDARPDDMAACLLEVPGGAAPPEVVGEVLELDRRALAGVRTQSFLLACGIQARDIPALLDSARAAAGSTGTVVLELRMTRDDAPQVTLRRARVARLHPPAARGSHLVGAVA